ncbi:YwpF-like protein [Terribacillus halophilus]|uniref:YwpF-like protein n=1 Tax=Terribacillus halophilus TaxID=361279 RepID=A0A1G6NQ23_9BACI|nr:YwpF family protein [Terribacillus halophilus]SDC69265.1 YwpF-like protein [Terribacillus halophilus]
MKTFKLVELTLYPTDQGSAQGKEMKLTEGLIINKEEDNEWVLEAVLGKTDLDYVQTLSENRKVQLAEVRITKPENRPALFVIQVQEVNDLEEEGNVIMKGSLAREDRLDLLTSISKLRKDGLGEDEILSSRFGSAE